MWGAFARQAFAYVLTRRGKRALAFVGMILLGFITALLSDMQLYISAAFTGTLAFVVVTMWGVQYWRVKQHDRMREMRRLEAAARRLAIAHERDERRNRAKAKVADAVRAAGANTVGAFGAGVAAVRLAAQVSADTVKSEVLAVASQAKSDVTAAAHAAARVADSARFWRRPARNG